MYYYSSPFGLGRDPIFMTTRCTGTESNLLECSNNFFIGGRCSHNNDIGLKCEGKNTYTRRYNNYFEPIYMKS